MAILATYVLKIVSDVMKESADFFLITLLYNIETGHDKLRLLCHILVTKMLVTHELKYFSY
jgi:hypothetical protein